MITIKKDKKFIKRVEEAWKRYDNGEKCSINLVSLREIIEEDPPQTDIIVFLKAGQPFQLPNGIWLTPCEGVCPGGAGASCCGVDIKIS